MWQWNNIHTGEHTGTHLDAPAHWVSGRDGATVDQIALTRLVGPAVVVDVSDEVAANSDFLLEPEHLLAWEEEQRPGAGRLLAAVAQRVERSGARRGRVPQRRRERSAHPGPFGGGGPMVGRRAFDHRLRGGDGRHRRRQCGRDGSAVPGAQLPAGRRHVRAHPAAESRPAARHRGRAGGDAACRSSGAVAARRAWWPWSSTHDQDTDAGRRGRGPDAGPTGRRARVRSGRQRQLRHDQRPAGRRGAVPGGAARGRGGQHGRRVRPHQWPGERAVGASGTRADQRRHRASPRRPRAARRCWCWPPTSRPPRCARTSASTPADSSPPRARSRSGCTRQSRPSTMWSAPGERLATPAVRWSSAFPWTCRPSRRSRDRSSRPRDRCRSGPGSTPRSSWPPC